MGLKLKSVCVVNAGKRVHAYPTADSKTLKIGAEMIENTEATLSLFWMTSFQAIWSVGWRV